MADSPATPAAPAYGGHKHGNFPRYYSFNPVASRTSVILPSTIGAWWADTHPAESGSVLRVLDLGCNSGDLSVELARLLGQGSGRHVALVGVDLDSDLIQRAQGLDVPDGVSAVFVAGDVMVASDAAAVVAAVDQLDGDSPRPADAHPFDLVFCLGLGMWIHVNAGDDGLMAFLRQCASWGAALVYEQHTWDNYRKCRSRLRRKKLPLPPAYDTMAIRGNVADTVAAFLVDDCGLVPSAVLGVTKWSRTITLYVHDPDLPNLAPGDLAPGDLAPGDLAPGDLAPGDLAPGDLALAPADLAPESAAASALPPQ